MSTMTNLFQFRFGTKDRRKPTHLTQLDAGIAEMTIVLLVVDTAGPSASHARNLDTTEVIA